MVYTWEFSYWLKKQFMRILNVSWISITGIRTKPPPDKNHPDKSHPDKNPPGHNPSRTKTLPDKNHPIIILYIEVK